MRFYFRLSIQDKRDTLLSTSHSYRSWVSMGERPAAAGGGGRVGTIMQESFSVKSKSYKISRQVYDVSFGPLCTTLYGMSIIFNLKDNMWVEK